MEMESFSEPEYLKHLTNSSQQLIEQFPPAFHGKYNYSNSQADLGYLVKDYVVALKSI